MSTILRRRWPYLLGSGFSPTSIPNLELWLDGADASTITLDGSNNVSGWTDKSGNARNAAQATALSRPSYTSSNQINGINVPRFDGTDDRLSIAHDAALSGSSYTIFAVVDNDSTGSAFRAWLEKAADPSPTNRKFFIGTNQDIGAPWTPANMVVVADGESTIAGGNGIKQQSGSANVNAVLVTQQKDASAAAYLWTDGVLRATTLTPNTNSGNTSAFNIGGTNYPWLGKVAEVLYYSRALDSAERGAVESYLRRKWQPTYSAPAGISSGLAFWIDASDSSTITLDGSNNIIQIRDKSGNYRHAQQSNASLRPNLVTAGQNGLNTLRTTSAGNLNIVTENFSAETFFGSTRNTMTRFVVWKRTGGTISQRVYDGSDLNRVDLHTDTGAPSNWTTTGYSITPFSSTIAFRVITNRFDGPNSKHDSWANGTKVATQTDFTGLAMASNSNYRVQFGNNPVGSDSEFAECIVYDRALSDADTSAVINYLRAKWFPAYAPPGGVSSGLQLWLDASDASTVLLDGSSNVQEWLDKSGNQRSAYQGTTLNRPQYLTNQLNGLSAVKPNGTSHTLDVVGFPSLSAGYTCYIVAQVNTVGGRGALSIGTGTVGNAFALGTTGGNLINSQWGDSLTQALPANGTNYAFFTKYDGSHTTGNYQLRQSTQSSTATKAMTQNNGTPPAGTLTLFNLPTVGLWSTNFYEIIIYDRQTTAGEDAAIQSYITSKWGISWL